MASLTDPFAKPTQKHLKAQKPSVKKDSTRENVKRQLINALEKSKDNSLPGLKFISKMKILARKENIEIK